MRESHYLAIKQSRSCRDISIIDCDTVAKGAGISSKMFQQQPEATFLADHGRKVGAVCRKQSPDVVLNQM